MVVSNAPIIAVFMPWLEASALSVDPPMGRVASGTWRGAMARRTNQAHRGALTEDNAASVHARRRAAAGNRRIQAKTGAWAAVYLITGDVTWART